MRRVLVTVLVVSVLVCIAPAATNAYSTTYTLQTAPAGTFAFNPLAPDYCTLQDSASHTAMSVSASVQRALESAYNREGLTGNVPLGGMTQQAACVGTQCEWMWHRGLYKTIRPLFLYGVYYWGPDDASTPVDRTERIPGSYTNFETNYPRSWANLSYWGKRMVMMQPSGRWVNTEIATTFSNFLCEYYVYADSDGVNGLMPTFPGGSVIPMVSSSGKVYTFCDVDVTTDSLGRWVLPKCKEAFPWWAGLILAVVLYILLIGLIIGVWCCCCAKRSAKEKRHREKVLASARDNEADIPFQSEMGMSATESFSRRSMHNTEGSFAISRNASAAGR